jgi:tetratricopeptide (TPR) repeat protein
LRQANRLYQAGDYKQAALLYFELAERAQYNNLPQAANLYLRGGVAYLKISDDEQAEKLFRKSLLFCLENKRWPQLERILDVAEAELDSAGKPEMAADLRAWVMGKLPSEIQLASSQGRAEEHFTSGNVKLPSNCPNCGGPVQPKEIEWYDAANPICAYCGSVLRDE